MAFAAAKSFINCPWYRPFLAGRRRTGVAENLSSKIARRHGQFVELKEDNMVCFGVVASRISWNNSRICFVLSLAILAILCAMSSGAAAQSVTGAPPFGSVTTFGPDTVNLENLNVVLSIPIVQKPGRGLPFNFAMTYNSTVWAPVSNSQTNQLQWQWGTQAHGGWSSGIFGRLLLEGQVGTGGCPMAAPVYYYYADPGGGLHPFPFVRINSNPNCGPTNGSVEAQDGSGYQLDWNESPVAFTIYDKSGNKQQLEAGTLTDPDGNFITVATGGYSDTLGMPVLSVTAPTSSTQSFTYTGPETSQYPNGTPETVTFNYSSYTVATNFQCTGVAEASPTATALVSSISLPDGSSYSFQYEKTPSMSAYYTGRVSQITLPTGATIQYAYPGPNDGINCPDGTNLALTRTTSDGIWQYSRAIQTSSPYSETTTVTDPAGNQTVHLFASANSGGSSPYAETQTQIYQGSANGTPLETITTCFNSTAAPCTTPTYSVGVSGGNFSGWPKVGGTPAAMTVIRQLGTSPTSQTVTYYGNANLPIEIDVYDFGASSPTKVTKIAYASLSGNILDRPSCVQITAGANANACGTVSANTVSLTNYEYFPDGKVQTASAWVSGSTFLKRSFTYYANGLTETSTDVNSTQTTYGYQDCNNTPAYLSSVSSEGLTTSYTWDCNGGVVTQVKDANGQPTNYGYVNQIGTPEPFWRLNSTTDALSNVTWKTYTHATSTAPATVETALSFPTSSPTSTVDTLNTMDGFGRPSMSQERTGPSATTFDQTVHYTYGWTSKGTVTGRFIQRTIPGGTAVTTTQLDALGRTASVTDGGGGTTSYTYVQNDVLQSVGPTQTFQKQLQYDGLGRITSVCEITPDSGSGVCSQINPENGFLTKYTYDALGNLLTVNQNAQSGASGGTQTRTYVYDGMSRLTSESNPESGNVTYTYDVVPSGCFATANSAWPGVLTAITKNGTLTECLQFDALNRPYYDATPIGDFGSTTCARRFSFDGTSPSYFGVTAPGTISNGKGRLTEVETDNCDWPNPTPITDEWFSYDADGRMTDVYEKTPHSSGYYHTTASYWANGSVNTLGGVPNLSITTVTLDGEGRPYSATYGTTNWVKSATYYPSNSSTTITFGTGDTDVYGFDANTGRMNQFQFNVGATPKTLVGTVGWNANWTLGSLGISDGFNSANTQTCSYGYDSLARINTVNCGVNGSTNNVWSQNFTLDAFGNLSKSGSSSFAASYLQANGTTNNQEVSVASCVPAYDVNGNLTKDCTSYITPATYTWDPFGTPASLNGVGLTYDALGREVEMAHGSTYTQVLYSPIGKLGLMGGNTAQTIRIALPGGSTAELIGGTGSQTHILHSDWLGSARLSTLYAGRSLAYDTAYAPYGENYAGSGSSPADLDFTGQYTDTLSELYDFLYRKYSPGQGRWISPDPAGLSAANLANPQTWNRYIYVENNPLSTIDPLGLDPGLDQLDCGIYCRLPDDEDLGDMGGSWDTNPFDPCAYATYADANADCGADGAPGLFPNGQPLLGGVKNFTASFITGAGDAWNPWSEWQAPLPASPQQMLGNVLSGNFSVFGIPTIGDLMKNPIMDAINIWNCPDSSGNDPCAAKWQAANQITNPCTIGVWYGASAIAASEVAEVGAEEATSEMAGQSGWFPELAHTMKNSRLSRYWNRFGKYASGAVLWVEQRAGSACNAIQ
jgi:RHS repeat-associated protein